MVRGQQAFSGRVHALEELTRAAAVPELEEHAGKSLLGLEDLRVVDGQGARAQG